MRVLCRHMGYGIGPQCTGIRCIRSRDASITSRSWTFGSLTLVAPCSDLSPQILQRRYRNQTSACHKMSTILIISCTCANWLSRVAWRLWKLRTHISQSLLPNRIGRPPYAVNSIICSLNPSNSSIYYSPGCRDCTLACCCRCCTSQRKGCPICGLSRLFGQR